MGMISALMCVKARLPIWRSIAATGFQIAGEEAEDKVTGPEVPQLDGSGTDAEFGSDLLHREPLDIV
jgi:hypothetical protein